MQKNQIVVTFLTFALAGGLFFLSACSGEGESAETTTASNSESEEASGDETAPENTGAQQTDAQQTDTQQEEEWSWEVPEDWDYQPPKPKKTGTLNMAYSSTPNTLNPLLANDTTSSEQIHYWTIESLASRSYRDPEQWAPRLATDWERHDDGMRWVIELREGVKFHPVEKPNGEMTEAREMTAYDVQFTYEAGMNTEVDAGHYRNFWKMIDEVNVIDEHTVEFIWGQKYFNIKGQTLGFPVIPEHIYGYDQDGNILSHDISSSEFAEGFNDHWANSNAVCGTGPLRLVEWERGEGFALERFEDYYGDQFPTPKSYADMDLSPKKPYFDRIEYNLVRQPSNQLRALFNEDIDIMMGLTPELYEQELKGNSMYEQGQIQDIIYDYPAYRYIGWNLRNPRFQNKKVRQALTHAVPREQLIERVFYGYARIQTGPFFFKYPAYNDDIEPYEHDLERAAQLLDEAGWDQRTDEGIRYKEIDGERVLFEFDLLHYADSPEFERVAGTIQQSLNEIGISANPEPTQWNEYLNDIRARQFDAMIIGWAMGYVSDPYQVWHSSQAPPEQGSNHVGWEQTDDLIEEIRRTMDDQNRRELYHEFHRIIHDHQPYTFLWTTKNIAAFHDHLHAVGQQADNELPTYSVRPNFDRLNFYFPAEEQGENTGESDGSSAEDQE